MAVIIIERDEDIPGVEAQFDVIDTLRRMITPLRSFICDTPWIEVRWPNPRYL